MKSQQDIRYWTAVTVGLVLSFGMAQSLGPVIKILDLKYGMWEEIVHSNKREDLTIIMEGLNDKVSVYFDEFGVPHIYANNLRDLARAFGYVQAMDRIWQMDLARRLAQGKLAEILGDIPEVIDSDKFYRIIGLERSAKETFNYISSNYPEVAEILKSFSAGINQYIKENENSLPLEYKVIGKKPALWSPIDSLSIGKLIAWTLSGNFLDLIVSKLYEAYGDELFRDLGFLERPRTLTIVKDRMMFSKLAYPKAIAYVNSEGLSQLITWFQKVSKITEYMIGSGLASNSWVVSPSLTEKGVAILANDPHLSLTVPPVWYEAHLVIPEKVNVRGVTFPGVPLIVIGRNERIAWGFTNLGADVVDFYYYKWDESGKRYFMNGSWREIEVVEETIKIAKGNSFREEVIKVNLTVHGPLIERDGSRFALRWVGNRVTLEVVAIKMINLANNFEEFKQALKYFHVPPQNVVYADVEGNIAYWAAGLIPIRVNGLPYLPFNGSNLEGSWIDFIPLNELPHIINPKEGYIVTANNMPVGTGYKYYLGYGWADRYRAERIENLIKNLKPLDVNEMFLIQGDNYLVQADFIIPRLLDSLDDDLTDIERKALDLLVKWDRRMVTGEVAPTIMYFLIENISDKVWNIVFKKAGIEERPTMPFEFIEKLIDEGKTVKWLGITPKDLIMRAFKDAIAELSSRLGSDFRNWVWGEVHKYAIEHPLGRALSWLNYPSLQAPGGPDTVNPGSGLNVKSGASYRQVIVLKAGEDSWNIIPGGQSGRRFSVHWSDQLSLWARLSYKVMKIPADPSMITKVEVRINFIPKR